MGIQAHLIILALGRGADEPPDWSALTDEYERVESQGKTAARYKCIDPSNEIYYGCTFDEKGRPRDDDASSREERMCKAQNEVLALAIAAASSEEDYAVHTSEQENTGQQDSQSPSLAKTISWNNESLVEWGFSLLDNLPWLSFYWIDGISARMSVFRSSNSMSMTQLIRSDVQQHGLWTSMFPGIPAAAVRIFVTNIMREKLDPLSTLPWIICYIILNSTTTRIQILQKLLLTPTYTWKSLQHHDVVKFLTDLSWSNGWRMLLSPPIMFSYSAVKFMTMQRIRRAIVQYTKELYAARSSSHTAQAHKSILQKLRSIPSFLCYKIVSTLGWTTDLMPFAARDLSIVRSKAIIQNEMNEDPGILALELVTELITLAVVRPLSAVHARAQALYFARIVGSPSLKSDIYPILPSLSGLTSAVGIQSAARYAGKIALCYSMECLSIAIMVQMRSVIVQHILKKQQRSRGRNLDEPTSDEA